MAQRVFIRTFFVWGKISGDGSDLGKVRMGVFLRGSNSVGGEATKAHDQAAAERIAKYGLAVLGLPGVAAESRGRGKRIREKAVIADVIRKRTGVGNL